MGVGFWQHFTTWHPDPLVALHNLQKEIFTERYNLRDIIETNLKNARESIRLIEAEGDPREILEHFRREVTTLEEIKAAPWPNEISDQIQVLRKVCSFSGEGIGDVLDVEAVSAKRDLGVACPLTAEETRSLFGTSTPTQENVQSTWRSLTGGIFGRGEGICFPAHDDQGVPVKWCFVGLSFD